MISIGCAEPTVDFKTEWETVESDLWVSTITHNGHDYVVLSGHKGAGVCHAASCPCRQHLEAE